MSRTTPGQRFRDAVVEESPLQVIGAINANYSGVMLQGFYWDSFSESKWTKLEAQAPELGQYFNLVWIPQSAYCGNKSRRKKNRNKA